jgi:peptidoglycan hydrolase-like protein with peptidoglycan-binding domain
VLAAVIEYALPVGRKPDPSFEMEPFRDAVHQIMSGEAVVRPLIPAVDSSKRPTLRRGARGELVKDLQVKLKLKADGIFGPNTEAKLREFQREHHLVPDGILGPKSWATLDGV